MRVVNIRYLLYFLLITIGYPMQALVVGSDSVASRNSFFTFPASDSDNEVRGFAVMDNGFALEDSTTTCTFNGFFPIRKQIYLNEGYLTLATNLILDNLATFTSLAHTKALNGEIRSLVLAHNTTSLASSDQGAISFENIELVLGNHVTLDGTLIFNDSCRIMGNGNILSLTDNANIIVNSNSQLELQNLILDGTQGENVKCVDDSGQLLLTKLTWVQYDNFYFKNGAITFNDKVTFAGTSTFCYDTAYTSTILADSTWKFTDGIVLRIGKHPISQAEPVAFEDKSSTINFDNVEFVINDQGMNLTKGKIRFTKTVSFEFESTSTSNGVILGTGDPVDDCIIEFAPAAVLNFNKGHFTYNDSIADGLRSQAKTAQINRDIDGHVYIAQDLVFSNINFYFPSLLVPTAVLNSGVTVLYDNVGIEFPSVKYDVTSQYYSAVADLLDGSGKQISVTKGSLQSGVVVDSTGSTIRGTGSIEGPIILTGPSAQLNWNNLGTLNAPITLNGGTLTLNADLYIVTGGGVSGPGTINLNGKKAFYGINAIVQNTPLTFLGGGNIQFNSKAELQSSILFQDKTIIEGFSNILEITTGELVVDSGAELVLKDMVIDGFGGTKIRCVDDTGVVTFNNVRMVLHDTFTFTHGAMQFNNKAEITSVSDYLFIYETPMTSTILEDSCLKLDAGVTFSYDPPHIEGNNRLLEFYQSNSELVMNGASFITTSSGIELTKGTLDVKRDSTIGSTENLTTGLERGVSFGDGINDFNIIIRPEVALTINSGFLEYRNSDTASLVLYNALSSITVASGATLQLYESLSTGAGRIIFQDNARLLRTNSSNIVGTIAPQGTLIRGTFTP